MVKFALALAALLSAAPPSGQPADDAPVSAWLESEPSGAGRTFTAFVRAKEAFSGRYELVAARVGPSGRSTSRQSGSVAAAPGRAVQLSRTAISPLGADDGWEVTLTVFQGEEAVARARQSR